MRPSAKKKLYPHKLVAMFPDEPKREVVMAILHPCGTETHERESERVWLAIFKISGANREQIRQNTALAKKNYRDILVAAEYPNPGRFLQVPESRN